MKNEIELYEVNGNAEKFGYRSDSGLFTVKREDGHSPYGIPFGGDWVLRFAGSYVGMDAYRNDLSERYGLRLTRSEKDNKDRG